MKKSFRKLIPVAAALGFAFAASSAQAFTLQNGAGTTYATNATSLDWNSTGSGVAKGVGSFNGGLALSTGKKFDFLYQANLSSVNGDTTGNFRGNLDSNANGTPNDSAAFEFTIVAKLSEVVKSSSVDPTTGFAQATFGLNNTAGANKVAIYYDKKANAKTSNGTGFDDGTMIALLTVDPTATLSTFTASSATSGQGSTKMKAGVLEAGDFINPAFLSGLSELLFNFDSNLNYPAGDSLTNAFHAGTGNNANTTLFPTYNVNASNDLVFKVDGALATAVPEPGTMMLLGLGMLGLVGAKRRRAPKA